MSAGIKANTDGTTGAVQVNGVDVITVTGAGNVGVNTTSLGTLSAPSRTIDVNANTSGAAVVRLGVNGTSTGAFWGDTTQTSVESYGASSALRLLTNGVERVRVAADGSQSSVVPGGTTLYPEFKCRAWVNFNGTGTPAVRAAGNVSSVTRVGTGDYTINLSTALPDVNYAATATARGDSDNAVFFFVAHMTVNSARTTSSLNVKTKYGQNGGTMGSADIPGIDVAIFR